MSDGQDVPSRFRLGVEGRTLLGIYRVERRLAEGGMGSVYLATDTNLGRRVVVKVPHVRFLAEPGFRARFQREIAELVRLEHPHVVRILAQGEVDEIPFFVLQFLGGGSLEDRLQGGPQPPPQVAAWLDTVAETLDYVHAQGVVHRDVKPANVLFDEQGHVFLSDFGVVKALEAKGSPPTVTEIGTGVGSPHYMAPEQAFGRAVTGATDQYGLASTVFEALAGEPPFGRGMPVETIVRKEREDAPSLLEKAPSVPPPCAEAVRRALGRDPAERFPTCRAFAEAFRAGLPTSSTATLPPAVTSAMPSRRRSLAMTLGPAALLAAVVAIGAWSGWIRGAPASPSGPPAPPAAPAGPSAAQALVRLASAGAEPRAARRMTLSAGAKDRLSTRMTQTQKREMEPGTPVEATDTLDQDVDVLVETVAADGKARLAWTFHSAKTPGAPAPEHPADDSAAADDGSEDAATHVGVVVGTSVLDGFGVSSDVALSPEARTRPRLPRARRSPAATTERRPASGAAELILSALREEVHGFYVVFPEEPIGVGAEWDVTRQTVAFGTRYQQTTTYTLLEAEGGRLRVKFQQSYSSPDQSWGLDEGMRIRSMSGSSAGEIVVDVDRALPRSLEAKGSLRMDVAVGDATSSRPVKFTKGFDVHATRD